MMNEYGQNNNMGWSNPKPDEWQQKQRQKWEMRMDRKHFSRVMLGLLLYTLISSGLQIIAVTLIQQSGWDYRPYRNTLNMLFMLICMYLLALPITAFYYRYVPKFGELRHEKWEWKAWLVIYLIGSSMGYFGSFIGSMISSFSGGTAENYEALLNMILGGNPLLTCLTVAVGAPIVEELLFRKFFIDRVIGYGEKLSVLLSGLIFGLMHGNFQQFFYAFALGCLFAYIYCKTGKIRYTILFHMWINFRSSVLLPLLLRPVLSLTTSMDMDIAQTELTLQIMEQPLILLLVLMLCAYVIIEFILAVVGLILFFVFKKYICFYPGLRQLPKKQALVTAILNPGMFAFLFLCIIEFF